MPSTSCSPRQISSFLLPSVAALCSVLQSTLTCLELVLENGGAPHLLPSTPGSLPDLEAGDGEHTNHCLVPDPVGHIEASLHNSESNLRVCSDLDIAVRSVVACPGVSAATRPVSSSAASVAAVPPALLLFLETGDCCEDTDFDLGDGNRNDTEVGIETKIEEDLSGDGERNDGACLLGSDGEGTSDAFLDLKRWWNAEEFLERHTSRAHDDETDRAAHPTELEHQSEAEPGELPLHAPTVTHPFDAAHLACALDTQHVSRLRRHNIR